MCDFDIEYEYVGFSNGLGLYTDNDIYWGEIKKHAVINEDGSGSIDIAAGNNEYLPKKAEQLGYLQAHVEAFIGMQAVSFSEDKCKIYLDISDVQINQLKRMKCHYKFRIFSDTITFFVRETAVKFFTIGFEKAWDEISERMESDGISMDR